MPEPPQIVQGPPLSENASLCVRIALFVALSIAPLSLYLRRYRPVSVALIGYRALSLEPPLRFFEAPLPLFPSGPPVPCPFSCRIVVAFGSLPSLNWL